MASCSPTDTAGPLTAHRGAHGRESPTAGRRAYGAGLEHVPVLAVCRFCSASLTAAAGGVHLGVVTANTPASRTTGGRRAAAGPRVSRCRVPLTAARSRPTAAAGRKACRRPARPAAPRHQHRLAGSGTASVVAALAAVRISLIGVAGADERQHRLGEVEAVLDPHKRSNSTPETPTKAPTVIADQPVTHRFQQRAVVEKLPEAGGVALTRRAAHRRRRRWTPPRAASLTASGPNRRPPAGNHMATHRQDLMAAHSP